MSWCGSDGGSRKNASCVSTAPWESCSLSFWGKKCDYGAPDPFGEGRAVSAKSYWECHLNADSRAKILTTPFGSSGRQ